MKKLGVFLLGFVVSVQCFAGGSEIGNGGDVVVCGEKVELLDVYEARVRGMIISLGDPAGSVENHMNFAIERLANLDPAIALVIKNNFATFFQDTKIMADVELRDINGSNEVFLPPGCELKQIAVQGLGVMPFDPYYIIDEKLWNRLDNLNKTALILHEIIFRASKWEGKVIWDSPVVRAYNSLVFSDLTSRGGKLFYDKIFDELSPRFFKNWTFYDKGSKNWFYLQGAELDFHARYFITPDNQSNDVGEAVQKLCEIQRGTVATKMDIPVIQQFVFTHLPTKIESGVFWLVFHSTDKYTGIKLYPNDYEEQNEFTANGYYFCKSKQRPSSGP